VRTVTLLYHDLVNGDPDASGFPGGGPARYKLSEAEFVRHLDALAAARADAPVRVGESPAAGPSRMPWLLTFDDGGASARRTAELLERRGWRGHFFVTVGRIGTRGFVASEDVRTLRRAGHVVGSHSFSHPDPMSGCPPDVLAEEWGRSRKELEQILGEPVTAASVPGGSYSGSVGRAAAAAGFRALFTSEPVTREAEIDRCRVLGRFTLWRGVPPEVAAALVSARLGPRLSQFLAWNARKAGKRVGGSYYLRLRRAVLERRLRRTGRSPRAGGG